VVGALLTAVALSGSARAQSTPPLVRESGYVVMDDGIQLRYTVVRPAGVGPWPTLFEYSGYDPGTNPDASYIRRFVERDGGYAYIGVNIRGTGCSEGTFDFFQPREALDGAAVIAWIRSANGWVASTSTSIRCARSQSTRPSTPPNLPTRSSPAGRAGSATRPASDEVTA